MWITNIRFTRGCCCRAHTFPIELHSIGGDCSVLRVRRPSDCASFTYSGASLPKAINAITFLCSLRRHEMGWTDLASNQVVISLFHPRQCHVRCSPAARPVQPDGDVGQGGSLNLWDCNCIARADREASHVPVIRLLLRVQVHGQGLAHLGSHVHALASAVAPLLVEGATRRYHGHLGCCLGLAPLNPSGFRSDPHE